MSNIPDDLMQKIDEYLASIRTQVELAYLRGRLDQAHEEIERAQQQIKRMKEPTIVMDRSSSVTIPREGT